MTQAGEKGTVLLNVDEALKKAALRYEFCPSVPKRHEGKLKPVGRLGPLGGWSQ